MQLRNALEVREDLNVLGTGEHVEGDDFPDLVAAGGEDMPQVPQKDLQVAGEIKDMFRQILLGQKSGQ